MKNKVAFILIFIFFVSFISVQNTNAQQYDYSRFRFPNVKVKGLNSTANLYGSKYSHKNTKQVDFESSQFNYSINGNYFLFTNDIVQQKLDRVYFYHSLDYNKNFPNLIINNQNRTIKSRNVQLSISKQQVNRKYSNTAGALFGIQNRFFEFDHNIELDYNNRYIKNELDENKQNSIGVFATLPVKIGYGRIEPMNDLFLAQFLMDDLLQAGLITTDFAEDQLFELAQLMSSVRNQRVFDYRRANIYQLTEISGWMEKNNIPQNIQSFTVLSDNWQYAFNNTRNHGKRTSMGLIPWVDYLQINYLNSGDYRETMYGFGLQTEYIDSKAVSQYVQRDLFFGLAQHIQRDKNIDYNYITNLQAALRYGYHPNSRTTYGITPSIDYYLFDFKDHALDLKIDFSASYFINNRARINANFGVGYNATSTDTFYNRGFPSYFSSTNTLPGSLIPISNNNGFSEGNRFQLNGGINFNYAFF